MLKKVLRIAPKAHCWSSGPVLSNCTVSRLISSVPNEDELVNLFEPHRKIRHEQELPPVEEISPVKQNRDKRDIIISCLRPEFNHYKNQRYDHFKPIPLASKGWHHDKSKGDHFTIHLSSEEESRDLLFWGSESKDFKSLKIDDGIIEALKVLGVEKPTKVQEMAIPAVLKGRNALISAETGCGKTLAYLIPVIQQVMRWNLQIQNRKPNSPLALILCPSRDLALQIGKVAKLLSHQLPFSCHVVTGGRTKKMMLNPQFSYFDVLIGTLGAISKLKTVGIFNLSDVRHIVLDEADSLLDDSFNEHLCRFLSKIKIQEMPSGRDTYPQFTQLSLVSATVPRSLDSILEGIIEPGTLMKITTDRLHKVLTHVRQTFYRLGPSQKPSKLLSLVKASYSKKEPTLIFSNKSKACDWVSLMLNENGVENLNLNGDMPHILRKGTFEAFQEGRVNVLSCTDIASRGLDTRRVKHLINFDFPVYMSDYIHRCGRTGRVGSPVDCRISNLVSGYREVELVQKIELAVRTIDPLPNVNANINRIIRSRMVASVDKDMSYSIEEPNQEMLNNRNRNAKSLSLFSEVVPITSVKLDTRCFKAGLLTKRRRDPSTDYYLFFHLFSPVNN